MESTDSSGGSPRQPHLPPGFRFHPTDEELVVHYLKKKATSAPLPVSIVAEVDIYKFDPWELPAKATYGEQEWYFFTPRDRKYPNGARPNRAATSGYWKATGTDKPVLSSGGTQKVGVKKALVFYGGKPPKGVKTNWIMHEYRLMENKLNNRPPGCDLGNKKNSLRLDDWVLCRIYKKSTSNRQPDTDKEESSTMDDMLESIQPSLTVAPGGQGLRLSHLSRPTLGTFFDSDHAVFDTLTSSGCLSSSAPPHLPPLKRNLPSLYWGDEKDDENAAMEASLGKRTSYGVDTAATEGSGSIASLLGQLPATGPSLPAALGDGGVFRPSPYQLQGLNWYA